jgi:hypothetical protein
MSRLPLESAKRLIQLMNGLSIPRESRLLNKFEGAPGEPLANGWMRAFLKSEPAGLPGRLWQSMTPTANGGAS